MGRGPNPGPPVMVQVPNMHAGVPMPHATWRPHDQQGHARREVDGCMAVATLHASK